METSLHRELKQRYAGESAQVEVRRGQYRIDAVVDGELVEIQHGSLAAIRDKVAQLLRKDRVRVVKPIVAEKRLIKLACEGGPVVSSRLSPKRGTLLDVFDDLIYFTRVFPHPRLTLEVVLVEIEEFRYPGHGRRRRHRHNDFEVEDQKLCRVVESQRLITLADLRALAPGKLPARFDTGHLAALLGVARFRAQRMAYCFRQMGATQVVGKAGNAMLYRWTPSTRRRRKAG